MPAIPAATAARMSQSNRRRPSTPPRYPKPLRREQQQIGRGLRMFHVAAVDDLRLSRKPERANGNGNLRLAAGRGDDPPQPEALDRSQHVSEPGQGPRRDVQPVERLARSTVDPLDILSSRRYRFPVPTSRRPLPPTRSSADLSRRPRSPAGEHLEQPSMPR